MPDGHSWMVARDGLGDTPNTYGPFGSREEAQAFVDRARESFEKSGHIGNPGFVYDAVAQRKSPCGPWYS